jgi:acyl dehydratase
MATIKAADLAGLAGRELEPSPWFEITQDRVNDFADTTNDHQFIHVDPERAALTPLGGTIAHGFLTLSLIPFLTAETADSVEGLAMALNYGSDRVRFLQPVRVGSRVRARQKYLKAEEKRPGQWMVSIRVTIEIEGEKRPALIADTLTLFILR